MITQEKFNETISKMNELERRGSFYDMAVNLIDNNFEIEAYLLILATWNFAVFRYAVKDFNIDSFKKTMEELAPYFDRLKGKDFKTIEFDKYKKDITRIYETLAKIKGVQYTGASKIMHLKNRSVFIMWDNYIRGHKLEKHYNELEIVKEKNWKKQEYGNDAGSYLRFLKDMQALFKGIEFQSDKKTFAKAIDEFNYISITLPIQDMEKGLFDFVELNLLKGKAKKDILREIADYSKKKGVVKDADALYKVFMEREKAGTTGIGSGMAIPEAAWIDMDRPYASMLFRTRYPVEYNSIDGKPVRIILAVLGRDKDDDSRLNAMAKMSRLLKDARFRDGFIETRSKKEAKKLIKHELKEIEK